jgi:GT2 family glycosyltransferase
MADPAFPNVSSVSNVSGVSSTSSDSSTSGASDTSNPRAARTRRISPDRGETLPLGERITVVLLTYNCAHRLGRILDEVLALGVPVVAVDNGSHDETAQVLAERSDVQVIRLARNIGAAGRNAGAAAARTPYVAFCDDDGWYEKEGLALACDLLDQHPSVGLINARIVVGPREDLDPISAEMAATPLADTEGLPGLPILGFMAGAVVVRTSAFREAGGYDVRFFMGGEEETLALPLARQGWRLRYVPEVVVHHYPSMSNAGNLRAYGMSNTILNAWLHRRTRSALRWTAFVLVDTPKTADYVRGVVRVARNLTWVLRERRPLAPDLDAQLQHLDRRRFASRRPFLTFRDWRPTDAVVDIQDAVVG